MGAIVNDSRSLVVQLKHFSSNKEDKNIPIIAYRQIAWCYSLAQSLRKTDPFENAKNFLSDADLEALKQHKNVPLAIIDLNAKNLANMKENNSLTDFQHMQIDSTLVRLCASMGKAERIKNTSFPKTYRLTLHLFIYIFLVLLSLSLTKLLGFIEIPLAIIISIPYFLLDKIAFNIQDPFENKPTDTAMTSISTTIETNIKQLIEDENLPDPATSGEFYIL